MHCRVANGHLDSISHLCWRRLSTSFFFQDRQEIYRKKAQALLPCCGSLQLHSLTSWLLWLHLEIYWGRYCCFFSTEIPLFNTAVQYGRSIHRRLAARAKDHQNGCSIHDPMVITDFAAVIGQWQMGRGLLDRCIEKHWDPSAPSNKKYNTEY